MRQFNIGQVVTCIPDMFLRHAASGDYKVIAAMPDRDGDHMYRIKSPLGRAPTCRKGKSSRQIRRLFAGRSSKAEFSPEINHTAHAAGGVGEAGRRFAHK